MSLQRTCFFLLATHMRDHIVYSGYNFSGIVFSLLYLLISIMSKVTFLSAGKLYLQ